MGLGLDQALVHVQGFGLAPLAQLVGGDVVAIAAGGAGVVEQLVVLTGGLIAVDLIGMALGRDGGLGVEDHAALGAVGAFRQTGGGTGGSHGGVGDDAVVTGHGGGRLDGCAAHGEGGGPEDHVFACVLQRAGADVVVTDVSGDLIGVVIRGKAAKGQTIIHDAAVQCVGSAVGGVGAGEDGGHQGVLAGVDLGVGGVDGIVLGDQFAGEAVGGTQVDVIGHGGVDHRQVIVTLLADGELAGQDVADDAAAIHLIPILAGGVLIQAGDHHGRIGRDGALGAVAGGGVLADGGGGVGHRVGVGGVVGTLGQVAGIAAVAGEFSIAVVAVHIAGDAADGAFPGVLPQPGAAIVGGGAVGAEAVDLGDPLGEGGQVAGLKGTTEPAGEAVEAGLIAGLGDGVTEGHDQVFLQAGAEGGLGAVFHVVPDGQVRREAVGLQGVDHEFRFGLGLGGGQTVGVMVDTVGDAIGFAVFGVLQEPVVQGLRETDTQDREVDHVLGLGPVDGAVPGGNVDAEGQLVVGVGPFSDHALLGLQHHGLGRGGQSVAVVDVVADRLGGDHICIVAGGQAAEGQTVVYGAAGEAVGLAGGFVGGHDGGGLGDVGAGVHGTGDGAEVVQRRADVALDHEGAAISQRGGGLDVIDRHVTSQMIHQGGGGGVEVQGHVIIQHLVPIGIGGVLMQGLDGEHGVHRKGIFRIGGGGGQLHQVDRLGGLDTEVGGVGGGDVGGSAGGFGGRSDVHHGHQHQCSQENG